jgi:hypothetical protein
MSANELISAKYLKPDDHEPSAVTNREPRQSAAPHGEHLAAISRASRWISVVAGMAILACAIAVAVPYLSAALSKKANSPVDWLIQVTTGKRSDQIVDKWIRDRTELNQQDVKKNFTSGPAFQTGPSQPINWNFGTSTSGS